MTESTGVWQVIKEVAPALSIRMERLEVRGRAGVPDVLWVHSSGMVGRVELKLLRPGRWHEGRAPIRKLGVRVPQAIALRNWVDAGGRGGILTREMHGTSRAKDRWWYAPAYGTDAWVRSVLSDRWGEAAHPSFGTRTTLVTWLEEMLLGTGGGAYA